VNVPVPVHAGQIKNLKQATTPPPISFASVRSDHARDIITALAPSHQSMIVGFGEKVKF
jgi:hypothetical protein